VLIISQAILGLPIQYLAGLNISILSGIEKANAISNISILSGMIVNIFYSGNNLD
jgi:hypothetical protein